MDEFLLTPQEVADRLKVKKNTVYEMIKRGDLTAKKMGKQYRISSSEIEKYVQEPDTIDYSERVEPINPFIRSVSGEMIVCGQDLILDMLCNHLMMKLPTLRVLRSYLGSYNGLYAMYQGTVNVATAHLWDGDTDSYNISYVKKMIPGFETVVIHMVKRMQGFYVAKGNPKHITGFEDLTRSDVTMVNREKGSGTRILLDEYLRLKQIDSSQIKGYERETNTHLACASVISRGGADVSLGNRKVANQLKDIEFIPIQLESYDLVLLKKDMEKVEYQTLLSIIQSDTFRQEVEMLEDYDVTDFGKIL